MPAPVKKVSYTAKLQTADFYFQKILPRTLMHKACIEAGAESVMAMDEAKLRLIILR